MRASSNAVRSPHLLDSVLRHGPNAAASCDSRQADRRTPSSRVPRKSGGPPRIVGLLQPWLGHPRTGAPSRLRRRLRPRLLESALRLLGRRGTACVRSRAARLTLSWRSRRVLDDVRLLNELREEWLVDN